jgi:hypothetical protein
MRRPCLVVLACCALLVATVAPAAAAPVALNRVQIAFTMPTGDHSVWLGSTANCLIFTGGWSRYSTQRFLGATSRPRGLLDVGGRSGEAIVPGEAIHVDRIFGARPKALAAADVGLQLDGRRAYLTGTIRRSRSHSARRAPRRRLARLSGVKLTSRTTHGQLVVTVRGRATMLPALAGALDRLRCKGLRESGRPIRAGAALGPLTATIAPAGVTALAGTFEASPLLLGSADPSPTIAATGGAQLNDPRLRFAWAPGTRVPATCPFGECAPSGGTLRLVGGFDVVQGTRRLSFTDLAIDSAGKRHTLSATVAGVRHTVAVGSGDDRNWLFSDELNALLAATFGDPDLTGQLQVPTFAATSLAPA